MLVAVVILGFTDAIIFVGMFCPSAVTLLAKIALINDDDDVPDDDDVTMDGEAETVIDDTDVEFMVRLIGDEYIDVIGRFC